MKFADNSTQTTAFVAGSYATIAQLRDSLAKVRTEMSSLHSRIAALENLLVPFSRSNTEIYITGANLNIRNDSGGTNTVNGLGNLIVGYNEAQTSGSNKTGSHNIVGGAYNNYSSYGGLVVGVYNGSTAPYSTVTSGSYNIASKDQASVSGGYFNTASGLNSSISGGVSNTASSSNSSVAGGESVTAAIPNRMAAQGTVTP